MSEMRGDHWTEEEMATEVRRLRYLYPDGQEWYHRLWLAWLRITDQEQHAFYCAAWEQIKKEDEQNR